MIIFNPQTNTLIPMNKINYLTLVAVFTSAIMLWACSKNDPEAPVQQTFQYKDGIGVTLSNNCFNPNQVNPIQPCPLMRRPVCACGQFTFNNRCEAEAYGFYNYTEGTCLQQKCYNKHLKETLKDLRCQEKEDFVCGCNNLTYRNPCEAYKDGITQFKPGKCEYGYGINLDSLRENGCFDPSTVDTLAVCPTFDPVCACGLVQFANECEAKSFGFQNYEKGLCPQKRCKSDYLPGYYLALGMTCAPGVPVCGCDGVTYKSACHAVVSGTLYWTPGRCGTISTTN